ncbi:MAG TPA: phosphatase PAP2 family protein [Kofleriaceae bacterium]|nr:phosphatase PAP2 family protein [Kofleriaceae bacterium]
MPDVLARIAQPKVVVGLAAVTSAMFHRRPGVGARMLVAVPLTLAASNVLKRLDPEQRPRLWDRHPRESFPSSHSSAVTAYALSLVDSFAAWWALPVAGAAIAAVNVARVRAREHWCSDVLCGDLIGLAGAAAGALVARAWLRRRRGRDRESRIIDSKAD